MWVKYCLTSVLGQSKLLAVIAFLLSLSKNTELTPRDHEVSNWMQIQRNRAFLEPYSSKMVYKNKKPVLYSFYTKEVLNIHETPCDVTYLEQKCALFFSSREVCFRALFNDYFCNKKKLTI